MIPLVEDKWKPLVERGTEDRFLFGDKFDPDEYVKDYQKREAFRTGVSWHIPSEDLVKKLSSFSPVLSVGSGFGYTEHLAAKRGCNIICTDISPDQKNHWCRKGKFYMDVEKIDASKAVLKYSERNVFMAWPPYNNPMAADVVKNMEVGRFLIYVGEGGGGCTGDEDFFSILNGDFEEIEWIKISSWSGIHDFVGIYKKIR
jgi:hypothetical protein